MEYSDAPAVGELTVEKKGEVLDGFKGGLLASSYEKEFVYREGSLAGAKFKVYAAEDIYTADNQKDADGNRIKYYSEGDLVTTLTTGKDGKATSDENGKIAFVKDYPFALITGVGVGLRGRKKKNKQ